ncbi:MAG: H-X9-DG-CTERM domain-containing protein [Planctomycetaceae bacterium]
MPVYSFPCPHCSARLRLRDRRLIGRTFDCPDCGRAVVLEEDAGSGVIGGQRALAVLTGAEQRPDTVCKTNHMGSEGPRALPKWLAVAGSPLGVAWIVAAGLSAGLAGWLVSTPAGPAEVRSDASSIDAPAGPADAPGLPAVEGADLNPAGQVKGRFEKLFGGLSAHQVRTGSWPRGTTGGGALPPESRFSWLAALAAQSHPSGPQPHWDRPWSDPLNERFVRQRQDAFLNPAIDQQTGDNRYPASHFVGITGFGGDSDSLPEDHPRAGIFGSERATAPRDVPDGLANTMLIAGVDRHLGSWAAAGPSSLRGFTAEPFVNGPDGFGTGQADGMFVLMADGSVRFLSGQIDPAVIRRMAAKSDGLPLFGSNPTNDVTVQQPAAPQRPDVEAAAHGHFPVAPAAKAKPSPFDIAGVVADIAQGDDLPIDVLLVDDAQAAEELKAVDIEAALRQPIARFDQSTPVPAHRLLRTIEDMAAVSIDTSRLPATMPDALNQPVSLTLQQTTVGEILTAALEQLGLAYEVESNRLRVFVREPAN